MPDVRSGSRQGLEAALVNNRLFAVVLHIRIWFLKGNEFEIL